MDKMRELWSKRAIEHGRRSAIHLSVPEDQVENVTQRQQAALFALLAPRLSKVPASILDYGCGSGRFAYGLLNLTGAATYVGYDFCPELIEIAQQTVPDRRITFESGTPADFLERAKGFDLIWIHSVLGGVPDESLSGLTRDIVRTLASGGLIFITEATSEDNPGYGFWRFRTEAEYERCFSEHGVPLHKVGSIRDVANIHDNTVYAGAKP